jgi:glycosyltransferase involved in cell wall biosynthesis
MTVYAREDDREHVAGAYVDAGLGRTATVTVVIPALNEARNLPEVARQMPDGIDEIVFVDGHSEDNSVEVARALWPSATIISQTRRGKGNALVCGFNAATSDIVVMIDADGSTDPGEISLFVDALVGGADVAKGSRFATGGGSSDITVSRRIGNRALNALVNLKFGASFTDLCYGYMAFWRHNIPAMLLPHMDVSDPQWGDGFEIETLINVRVAAAGLKVVEVPSFESSRIHGVSHLSAVSDGLRILRTICRERRPPRQARHGSPDHLNVRLHNGPRL